MADEPTPPAAPAEDRFLPGIDAAFQIRARELLPAVVSLAWIFLALTAYYIIKPIRGTVLQTIIGVDNKPTAILATTAFVGVFAVVYGRIVAKVDRTKLIVGTYLIFVACLAAFAGALRTGGPLVGYTFFVWVSTFNVMVVSQFWALAADVWSKEEGTRLFGFIGLGTVSGGVVGTTVIAALAKTLSLSQMLLLSAALLGLCLVLSLYVLRLAARRAAEAPAPGAPAQAEEPHVNAVAMVLGSPYLRLIAAMTLLLNLINSNNEWILDKLLSRENLPKEEITAFYGRFYLIQNVLTVAIQVLLTSRIQKRFGAKVALLFLPAVGLLGGSAFLFVPILAVIQWEKVVENATDYSIQSNTREFLYLPASKLEKYAAKNVNDTFVVRIGDAVAAGSIWTATHYLLPTFGDVGLRVLVGIDVIAGLAWLFVVRKIGKLNAELMAKQG